MGLLELIGIFILGLGLFWGSFFASDFLIDHLKHPRRAGVFMFILALLIIAEFHDENRIIVGLAIFLGFIGARLFWWAD
jgi:hypothetical protein